YRSACRQRTREGANIAGWRNPVRRCGSSATSAARCRIRCRERWGQETMKLTLSRIAGFISATGEFESQVIASGYSIDSRTIQPGELFFAVKGERLDGHDFVEQALAKEAAAVVVQKDQLSRYPAKARLLIVDDSLIALQALAAAVRRLW